MNDVTETSSLLRDDGVRFLVKQNALIFDALSIKEATLAGKAAETSAIGTAIEDIMQQIKRIECKRAPRSDGLSLLDTHLDATKVCMVFPIIVQ